MSRPAAIVAYERRQEEAARLIAKLQAQLAEHSERAHEQPEHWGYAGDLTSVIENLARALGWVGGGWDGGES